MPKSLRALVHWWSSKTTSNSNNDQTNSSETSQKWWKRNKDPETIEKSAGANPYLPADKSKLCHGFVLSLCILIGISSFISLAILAVGVYYYVPTDTVFYYFRHLAFPVPAESNQSDPSSAIMALCNPFIFGILSGLLPLILLIVCLTRSSYTPAVDLMRVLMIVNYALGALQLIFTLYPLIALNQTSRTEITTALRASLHYNYFGLPAGLDLNKDKSVLWDELMARFACCGVDGADNFNVNHSLYSAITWTKVNKATSYKIPVRCCPLTEKSIDWAATKYSETVLFDPTCPIVGGQFISNSGCLDNLFTTYYTFSITTGICLLFAALLLLIAGLLATRLALGSRVEPLTSKTYKIPTPDISEETEHIKRVRLPPVTSVVASRTIA